MRVSARAIALQGRPLYASCGRCRAPFAPALWRAGNRAGCYGRWPL